MGARREDVNRRLLRARDLVDRRYAEEIDVARLAEVAVMAPDVLIREFRIAFGETPHRYLQRRRVERAMFLLRTTPRPVTEVCHAVGFTSLGTFSRLFREVVGVPPTAYRDAEGGCQEGVPTSFVMRWTRPVGFGEAHRAGRS